MHVFFDLDGTLTDSREGIVDRFRHALTRLGIDIPPDSRLESFIGPPMRDAFRELCGGGELGARDHGIRAVGVLRGCGSRQELESAGADALCEHPAEIPERVLGRRPRGES